ncbi:hypothetical protein C0989_007356 [Termitomyces sp. Mn162]|nr:hypothetical protein C0989_007356 [Termitomyces sp. Mn162]
MLLSVEEEWEELGGHVNMVVVLELGIRKEFIPVILVLIAEEAEVLLQLLIYVFSLAIGLQVVGGGGVELHAKQLVELPGEIHHELWSLVRDVGIGEAMELPDIPPVQPPTLFPALLNAPPNSPNPCPPSMPTLAINTSPEPLEPSPPFLTPSYASNSLL